MVSVIIPVYNREKSVVEAVNSVLKQTYKDLELIVVDDGSTDGTQKVLSQIHDSRFHYIYQNNDGACSARNHGIDLANGNYIAFHDSDDIWHIDKLAKQMEIFEKYDPDIVFCKQIKRHPNGKVTVEPSHLKNGRVEPIVNLFGIGTQTIVAKRKVFDNIKFDFELPRFQEFELLLRASKEYSIYCLDEGLVDYSVSEDSISNNPMKLYKTCDLILRKYPDFVKNYPEMAKFMAHSLLTGANQLRKENNNAYRQFIKRALKLSHDRKICVKAFLVYINFYSLSRKMRKKS